MLISHHPRRIVRGFSLVELMVAMVLGLIVIGAVIALVLSMMRANNQTIKSTRLNQELRATLAVVANDFKRARSRLDPLTAATQAPDNLDQIDTTTTGCVRYGYEGGVGGNWRSIRHDSATNRLVIVAADAQTGATCSSTGITLSSKQVAITSFTVTPTTPRQYEIAITGHLIDGDNQLAAINRTMRQSVFVRSIGQ